jgi:hypothetical protein
MSAKKTAKKSAATKSAGYKGHRVGSMKEKLHLIFDKQKPEAARVAALKIAPLGTVNTSFSQFRRNVKG